MLLLLLVSLKAYLSSFKYMATNMIHSMENVNIRLYNLDKGKFCVCNRRLYLTLKWIECKHKVLLFPIFSKALTSFEIP